MTRKVLAVSALLLAIALPAAAEATLDEILATNIESRGGRKALKSIESLRIEGRMAMGPGMEAPITLEMQRPASMRMEFTFQGMTGIQAYDGETGWQIMPFQGSSEPEKMSEEEAKQAIDQADIDGPLVDYADKGHTVELLGIEEVDGTEAHKIKLVRKNGDESIMFLDTEYCLEIKSKSKTKVQGTEMEVEVSYGDYKEVSGVMIAHSITQVTQGGPGAMSITFEKIEANVDMDADHFSMPAKEEPAAKEGE
jgi:hypothetical protein